MLKNNKNGRLKVLSIRKIKAIFEIIIFIQFINTVTQISRNQYQQKIISRVWYVE